MGTATNPWTTTGSGIFSNWAAITIAAITEGTSNTVAFSEGLTSDSVHSTKWRGGIAAGTYPPLYDDANMNITSLMNDLQTCTQFFNNKQSIPGSEDKGYRWATGSPGVTMFIKGSIAMPTWWALGTKDDNEVLNSGSY